MADTNTVTKEKEAVVNTTAPEQTPQTPVFEEIAEMTEEGAVNVVVQAAGMAQPPGHFTVGDSVIIFSELFKEI